MVKTNSFFRIFADYNEDGEEEENDDDEDIEEEQCNLYIVSDTVEAIFGCLPFALEYYFDIVDDGFGEGDEEDGEGEAYADEDPEDEDSEEKKPAKNKKKRKPVFQLELTPISSTSQEACHKSKRRGWMQTAINPKGVCSKLNYIIWG